MWFLLDLYLIRVGYVPQALNWTWIVGVDNKDKQLQFSHDVMFIPDSRLIFRNRPNIPDLTDSYGFRVDPANEENIVNTKKKIILALGDSVTWGDGSANNQTFSYYLSRNSDSYYVINAGTRSYGPDQEYLFFKDLILHEDKIKPSTVIWTLYSNDMADMIGFPLFVVNHNNLIQIPGWIHGVYLVRVILDHTPNWFINSRVGNFLLAHIQNINMISFVYNTPAKQRAFADEKLRLLLRDMALLCKTNHINLVMVVGPNQGILSRQPAFIQTHDDFVQILNASGLPYVDMNKYFIANRLSNVLGASTDYFNTDTQETGDAYDWKHPSSEGNNLIANILQPYIQSASLNP